MVPLYPKERRRQKDRTNVRQTERGIERKREISYGQSRNITKQYLLYRNKEIRPSNKRVLRSQFNSDLPETFVNSRQLDT